MSFVGVKLVLVIIKVKYRIMTSYIQYEVHYKYNTQYKFRPNPLRLLFMLLECEDTWQRLMTATPNRCGS